MAFARVGVHRSLASQLLIMQVVVLLVVMAAGFAAVAWFQRGEIDHFYEQRALAVAQSVASNDEVQDLVAAGKPGGELESIARATWRATGAEYVVITNAKGIRFTHPNPALIGKPVYSDPEPAKSEPFRTGKSWIGIQKGTLGMTARGKVPLFVGKHLIGEVSVGIPINDVEGYYLRELPTIIAAMTGALLLGVLMSLALSRRLKRQTFGLELHEIASLLQEREAMLHGIREGLLGIDRRQRLVVANDAATQLLGLPQDAVGKPVRELLPEGRLASVVLGDLRGDDHLLLVGDRVIVANRMPVVAGKRGRLGWVVTFQDRTEPEGLLRELDTVLGMTEALRAQSHEFSNQLHVLVGLVELGRYDEAIEFVTGVSRARNELIDRLAETISDPMVVALLLAKTSVAMERGIDLRFSLDRPIEGALNDVGDVLTVLGNLIDNAIDAASVTVGERWIEVQLASRSDELLIRVADSGPGVPENARLDVFGDGWSTKSSRTGARRGLGLALVRQVVDRHGGIVEIGQSVGAIFSVLLPGCVRPEAYDDSIQVAYTTAGEAP